MLLLAIALYYLNQEEGKPQRPKKPQSLISEPWIIPQNPTKKVAPISPSEPKAPEEPLTKWPSDESMVEPVAKFIEPLETDYSWLTDDNLEYILKNWEPVQTALTKANQAQKKFSLRTDIANIYNCFYKARDNQDWDLPELLQELERDKATYTLFPLRVNGNHWGLFILEEILREPLSPPMEGVSPSAQLVEVITKVYYASSGGGDLSKEKQQLQPFINQIVGENTPIAIIQPKDRNSKGYECGVYLCFYVREILESGELELKRTYSETECQEFRRKWKEKIGERWGKW